MMNLITERGILRFLLLKDIFLPKMARKDYTFSAVFVILWGIAGNPSPLVHPVSPRYTGI